MSQGGQLVAFGPFRSEFLGTADRREGGNTTIYLHEISIHPCLDFESGVT
jgi:hypothetical protein